MVEFQQIGRGGHIWRDELARCDMSSFVILAETTTWPGRLAFAGVFTLLIVWLLLVPRSLLAQSSEPVAWWRNVRVWAIVIAASQLLVYLLWV